MAGNDSVENDIFGEEPTGAEQTRPESQGSLLARVAHLAIGTALVATDMVDQGVATALEVNRRVLATAERIARPVLAPLDALGVTSLVRQRVETVTTTVDLVVGRLEEKGRTGLLAGDSISADVVGGVIDNVIAYLKQNSEVNQLIDAQIERLMPVLAESPAVQSLVRAQVEAILPQLIEDGAIQQLIRAQASQYLAYLLENPDQLVPLVRQQGDIYIDYLNEHPAEVQTLVQGQSLSLAGQVRDEVRERTVTGDAVVDAIVRSILRLKPREDLPPPPAEVQRRAESGKLASDFVKGRSNGNA